MRMRPVRSGCCRRHSFAVFALLALGAIACGDDDASDVDADGSVLATGEDAAVGDAGPCEVDLSYTPDIDPDDFTTEVDNPLFPLPVGAEWIYESEDEVITVTVTDETHLTAIGVTAVVVHDEARTPDGELIEDTFDWYAQDADGNVWYLGEQTAEYENGEVTTTAGSWEAGVDGAQPGIIMFGELPEIGTVYRQEYFACEAEDMGELIATGESVSVETGDYSDCIRVRDFTPLEPSANEFKTFCPGVGNVLVQDATTGDRTEELTSVSLP